VLGFKRRLDPVGLPERQFAAACSDFNCFVHYGVQLPQLVAAHPLQDDAAAEELSVIPLLLLLKKVEADISLVTF
jgi:hypothetical protein